MRVTVTFGRWQYDCLVHSKACADDGERREVLGLERGYGGVKLGARRVALGGHIKGQEVRHLRDHRLARHVQRTDLRGAALRQKQTANRCKARGHEGK